MPNRVVVFDANCLLCSRFIQVLLANDGSQLSYAGFESEFAQSTLPKHLLNEQETVVFYMDQSITIKSQAFFNILKFTTKRFSWLRIFNILPTSFLDTIYDWVARNRYGWFGKSDTCYVPTLEHSAKFLD